MYPGVRTLQERLGVDREKAKEIRGLLDGSISPDGYATVQAWVSQCYNPPRRSERVEYALNEVLGGFGIEAISGDVWDSFWGSTAAVYVNLGDTYACTLLYDTDKGRWYCTSWGDWLEAQERRGRTFA